jgi:basic membrane protein A and related proteins
MRRLWTVGGALVALNVALLLVRPGAREPGQGQGQASRAITPERRIRVGLVLDVGGLGDKSFNDSAFIGVERARRELGADVEMIEPGDGSDRESGLRLFAAKGFDVVFGVGFIFSDDVYAVALEYPNVRFGCVDYAKFGPQGFVEPPANMVALKFREEQGSFLVGALAALTSHSGVVGFVGGMDIPLIHKFAAGYAAGVAAVCPACRVLEGYAGVTAEAFKNPSKGKELALSQYAAGADVIFHASGSTGLGVFEAARATSRFAIGVDADQWDEAPGRVLSSMTKQVDVAVFETIRSLVENRFQSGVRIFGLDSGGVDYVYDDHNRALIPADMRARVEALRQDVIAGRIVVPEEAKP